RQRGQLGFLVFAALFGLAGCADAAPGLPQSEPPVPADSPSVSQPEDPADPEEEVPTPEPLPLPDYPEDLTAEDTAENAILAAEYFLELMNYAQSSGDAEPFKAVVLEQCKTCERFVSLLVDRSRAGGFLYGNMITIDDAKARRTKSGKAWEVASTWQVSDGVKQDSAGSAKTEVPGRTEEMRVAVALVDKKWALVEIAHG